MSAHITMTRAGICAEYVLKINQHKFEVYALRTDELNYTETSLWFEGNLL